MDYFETFDLDILDIRPDILHKLHSHALRSWLSAIGLMSWRTPQEVGPCVCAHARAHLCVSANEKGTQRSMTGLGNGYFSVISARAHTPNASIYILTPPLPRSRQEAAEFRARTHSQRKHTNATTNSVQARSCATSKNLWGSALRYL